MSYAIITNTPGYMPDSDDLNEYETRAEAVAARRDEILSTIDDMAETYGVDHPIIHEWFDAYFYNYEWDVIVLPRTDSLFDLGICLEIVEI